MPKREPMPDLPELRVIVTVAGKAIHNVGYANGETMAARVEQALCDLEGHEGDLIERAAIAAYGKGVGLPDAPDVSTLPC